MAEGGARAPASTSVACEIHVEPASARRRREQHDAYHDLEHNLYRFGYVLGKCGITSRWLGVTAHGLRHEALIEEFVVRTGQQPPVRGGGKLAPEVEKAARQAVAKLAGHARKRASNAYLGAVMCRKAGRAMNGPKE